MSYQQRWQALNTRFLALQKRERGLVALTLGVSIALLGWQYGVAPDLKRAQQAQVQAVSLEREAHGMTSRLASLEVELAQDPDARLRQQSQRLQRQLDDIQRRLETLAEELVSPEAMVALLQQMLSRHEALALQSVEHDPAVPVQSAQSKEGESSGLYSHRITVTVTGHYFDLVAYLQELEALDDRLGWSGLHYEVLEWPEARLRVRLKTLSLSEDWLGV